MTNATPSHSKDRRDKQADNKRGARLILEYSGMAARYLAVLGLSVWAGLKADQLIPGKLPVLVWVLPLLCVVGLVVKAIRDTSK